MIGELYKFGMEATDIAELCGTESGYVCLDVVVSSACRQNTTSVRDTYVNIESHDGIFPACAFQPSNLSLQLVLGIGRFSALLLSLSDRRTGLPLRLLLLLASRLRRSGIIAMLLLLRGAAGFWLLRRVALL